MSENYSFRSAMGGFNRNDVISYIEKILAEKNCLVAKLQEAEKINSQLENEVQFLKKDNESLNTELSEAKAKIEDSNKCDECDIAKKYEAHLGAAMLDAKRFSDTLVKEANEKAYGIFDEAYKKADVTAVNAGKLSAEIVDLNSQFNRYFKMLLDNIKGLEKSLDTFKGEVKSAKLPFACNEKLVTETIDSISDKSRSAEQEIFRHHRDINFDDADEFDIRVDI